MMPHLRFLLIIILVILADQADASFWFKVINVTPIQMQPQSESNFTVSVKGLGSERAYVELVFRNLTDEISISCPKKIKNVFPQGVTDFNCTANASDVAFGNYSFVVDVAAAGAPSGKKTAYIDVIPSEAQGAIQPEITNKTANKTQEEIQSRGTQDATQTPLRPSAKSTPVPWVIATVLALSLASRWRKRQ
jgi:hypothetical protein